MTRYVLDTIIDEASANALIAFLEEHKEDVEIVIDSEGGSVFDGLRVIRAIENHDGKVTARLGIVVASMAAIIALACDEVVATPNSFLMIHAPFVSIVGNAQELRDTSELLEQACNRCKEIVTDKAKNKDCVDQWFTGDTWFGFHEIVENFDGVVTEEKSLPITHTYASLQNKPIELVALLTKEEKVDNSYALKVMAELTDIE